MTEQVTEPAEGQTFTDHAHPILSTMIVDYIKAHPDPEAVIVFLGQIGIEDETARDYLAWLNGDSVTITEAMIHLPLEHQPLTLPPVEVVHIDITPDMAWKPTHSINVFKRQS